MTTDKTLVKKIGCPDCGSSDGLQVYQKNGKQDGYCFVCNKYYPEIKGDAPIVPNKINKPANYTLTLDQINELPSVELSDRGIRQEIVEYYGVKVGFSASERNKITKHYYPIHSTKGELKAYKQRNIDTKDFFRIGAKGASAFFGQNVCPLGRKVFITEGELDALALHQALRDTNSAKYRDSIPSVVSLSDGASSGVKQCVHNVEWLKKFAEVVLVFDNDDPGRNAAEEVAKTLDHDKILIATLSLKDPNEMLLQGKTKEMRSEVLINAQPYEPDGIINAADGWERYKERNNAESHLYPAAFKELNEKTYGWRFGSVVTITSGSGSGKTAFLRELKYDILTNTEYKIADIALEEDVGDTLAGLIALDLNKRIQLPDVTVTDEEEKEAFEKLFGDRRVELYDHFGGMNDDSLTNRIKYFNRYLGCRVFTLDHLSIIISETANEGDERRRIDALMTRLAVLAKSLDIVIFLVVHLKKAPQGKSFEQGYIASGDDLRGSAAIKQLSFDIITISRNQMANDIKIRNTSEVSVLKCRYTGRTGPAGFVYFDDVTGRMIEADDPVQAGDEFEDEEANERF